MSDHHPLTNKDRFERELRRDVAVYFDGLIRANRRRPAIRREKVGSLLSKTREKFSVSTGFIYDWWYVFRAKGKALKNFKAQKSKPKRHAREIRGLKAVYIRACFAYGLNNRRTIEHLHNLLHHHSPHGIAEVLGRAPDAAEHRMMKRLYQSIRHLSAYEHMNVTRDYPAKPVFSQSFARAVMDIVEDHTDHLNAKLHSPPPRRPFANYTWAINGPNDHPSAPRLRWLTS